MRKFVSLVPSIIAIATLVWGYFDPTVWVVIEAHPKVLLGLTIAFVVSETLAAMDWVKSNSLTQAVFDLIVGILSLILRKKT